MDLQFIEVLIPKISTLLNNINVKKTGIFTDEI